MKKLLFLIVLVTSFLVSCKKAEPVSCSFTAPSNVATLSEINYLQAYLDTNGIMAVQHQSGVFYSILMPGTGSLPNVCSTVTFKYEGRLLGGAVFDYNNSVTGVKSILGQLIIGVQRVLPVLKTGGTIILYIPPSLGYGPNVIYDHYNNVLVPANSYLQFRIDLLDVQ